MDEDKKSADAKAMADKQQKGSTIQVDGKTSVVGDSTRPSFFNPRFIGVLADEVAKLVIKRLPSRSPTKKKKNTSQKYLGAYILDTSAIIDGRIIEVITLGLLSGIVGVSESVLLELKHIADSKDPIKKDRGRRALDLLSKLKKTKGITFIVLQEETALVQKFQEVDERLIAMTKLYKGKLITCDNNLTKKATVHGITAINVHAVAQLLKVAAVPGESVVVSVVHVGKDPTQGVGYLDDGTMIVVEKGAGSVGQEMLVSIIRVIQTATGKILFAKKI